MKKQKDYLNKLREKISLAKQSLKSGEQELETANNRYSLASRVIENMASLRKMSDAEVRLRNLPFIRVEDAPESLIKMHAVGCSDEVVDFAMSSRLYALHKWLVNKHDSIYNIKWGNLGGIGIGMVGRSIKKGHSAHEFYDGVWDVMKHWVQLYTHRKMNEELYVALMNEQPEALYTKIAKKTWNN